MLLDTNIVIYACKPGGEWLVPWTNGPETAIASVTRIESLGYAGISREEDEAIRDFLAASLSYALDDEIVAKAILLRQ
jgi:predicted nucleic acid-binding protein